MNTLFNQPAPDHAPPSSHTAPETARAASVASSRANDPPTSREAAQRHEASGRASCNRERLLAEVCRGPGRTAGELVRFLQGIDHVEACRRLPELEAAGLVEPRGKRKCNERGSTMREWWATAAGMEAGPKRG